MSDGEPERGKGHREGQFGAELVQRQVGGFGQEGPNRVVVRSEFGHAGGPGHAGRGLAGFPEPLVEPTDPGRTDLEAGGDFGGRFAVLNRPQNPLASVGGNRSHRSTLVGVEGPSRKSYTIDDRGARLESNPH